MVAFRHTRLQTGTDVEIRQAVRVPRDLPFDLRIGERVGPVCLGRHAERDAAASGAPSREVNLPGEGQAGRRRRAEARRK
jgi:hypothetical protein